MVGMPPCDVDALKFDVLRFEEIIDPIGELGILLDRDGCVD